MTVPAGDEEEGPSGLHQHAIAILACGGGEPLGVVMPEEQRFVICDDPHDAVLEEVEHTTGGAWVATVLRRSDRLS